MSNSSWSSGTNSSELDAGTAVIVDVVVSDDSLTVELSDGRSIAAPIAWYPRLLHGSAAERSRWRLVGTGRGIHWPDLDEDISLEGLLAGRPSSETQRSLKQWLDRRAASSGA